VYGVFAQPSLIFMTLRKRSPVLLLSAGVPPLCALQVRQRAELLGRQQLRLGAGARRAVALVMTAAGVRVVGREAELGGRRRTWRWWRGSRLANAGRSCPYQVWRSSMPCWQPAPIRCVASARSSEAGSGGPLSSSSSVSCHSESECSGIRWNLTRPLFRSELMINYMEVINQPLLDNGFLPRRLYIWICHGHHTAMS